MCFGNWLQTSNPACQFQQLEAQDGVTIRSIEAQLHRLQFLLRLGIVLNPLSLPPPLEASILGVTVAINHSLL